jgi:2-iminobutanoate/2-iminopropanoate deaminase
MQTLTFGNLKSLIYTESAPKAIGPYSQAVRFGNLLFVSGQIAIEPETGRLLNGPIEEQTKQVIENIKAVVTAAGMTLDDVLKTSCFLKNMEDFAKFNEVYATYFSASLPARETVEVAKLPRDMLVEISCICAKE